MYTFQWGCVGVCVFAWCGGQGGVYWNHLSIFFISGVTMLTWILTNSACQIVPNQGSGKDWSPEKGVERIPTPKLQQWWLYSDGQSLCQFTPARRDSFKGNIAATSNVVNNEKNKMTLLLGKSIKSTMTKYAFTVKAKVWLGQCNINNPRRHYNADSEKITCSLLLLQYKTNFQNNIFHFQTLPFHLYFMRIALSSNFIISSYCNMIFTSKMVLPKQHVSVPVKNNNAWKWAGWTLVSVVLMSSMP